MANELSPYVPGDLPGLLDGWWGVVDALNPGDKRGWVTCSWDGRSSSDPRDFGCDGLRLSTLHPEVADRCSRWLAWIFGLPVGLMAPRWIRSGAYEWRLYGEEPHGQCTGTPTIGNYARFFVREPPNAYIAGRYRLYVTVSALSAIGTGYPDSYRDAFALAAVCNWVGDERKAGRLMLPTPAMGSLSCTP